MFITTPNPTIIPQPTNPTASSLTKNNIFDNGHHGIGLWNWPDGGNIAPEGNLFYNNSINNTVHAIALDWHYMGFAGKDNNIIEFTKELLKSSEEVNRNYYYSGVPIFLDDQNKNKYYSVFIVANDNQMPNKIIQILEKIIKDKKYKNYFIDKYHFTNEESLIAISELNQKENRNLIKEFETRYKEKIPILSKFVITEDNIKIVFETKKHTEYVEYINKKTSNE